MTIEIYLDATNGSDTLGNGSSLAPYRTLQYFCDSVAVKNNADYKVFLNNGVYEITNGTIFGQFNSGNMTIIGKGENTEIVQRAYMYQNSVGGNADFSLIIAKCKYNILTTLTGANVNGFRWKWSFYNVLFEYTPNNQTSVFSTSGKELVFRNCVKLTNTTSFLRKNSFVISVYDSMGYFTSGYQTTQADWDKGGNIIGSFDNYMEVLNYQGEYAWITSKSFILHDGEYKKWNEGQEPVDEYVSTIPPLTSNSSSSLGEAFGNGYAADYYQAFDGIDSTVWQGDKPTVGVIGFKYNKPICISRYILANYTATTRFNPKSWTFEGSNNGIDYTILDTKENITTSNPSITEATFNNNQTFLYYRFNITNISLADGTNRPHVHEIKLFEHKKESGVPPQWESISSTPPSYTQFLEQGMDSLSPLLDRKITTLEPMSMADKSEILGVGEIGKVFSKTIDLKKYFDIRNVRMEEK